MLIQVLYIHGKRERLVNGSGVNLGRHCFEEYPHGGKTIFLFVGRVMKERGILEYLEAAVRLHREDVEFAILGYCDEDYQELLNEYEEKGIISQWGFHTQVHPFLAKADAIVVASFHEGMSNALIEAAATGSLYNLVCCFHICIYHYLPVELPFHFFSGRFPHRCSFLPGKFQKFLHRPYQVVRISWRKAISCFAFLKSLPAAADIGSDHDRKIVIDAYMEAANEIIQRRRKEK